MNLNSYRLATGLLSLVVLFGPGCVGGHYARTGALGGGLAGGAIGAMAGAPSNRSLEGAAIGAVAGSLLGGAAGDIADHEVAHARAQDQARLQHARSQAVSPYQVIQLAQSGVDDQLIINQMASNGVIAPLTTEQVISLKQNGVSDQVIAAWQNTPAAGSATRVARVQPIIVEPAYGPDCYFPGGPCDSYPRCSWY